MSVFGKLAAICGMAASGFEQSGNMVDGAFQGGCNSMTHAESIKKRKARKAQKAAKKARRRNRR